MTREIPLTQGAVALVDDDDYDRLSVHKWCLLRTGRGDYPYAGRRTQANGRSTLTYLHRAVMGAAPGQQVDHKNGDTLDCRRANLRIATHRQNAANCKARGNPTGYRGVAEDHGTFKARLAGRYLGAYPTAEDAAVAYDKAALAEYGEFARTNFVDSASRPTPTALPRGHAHRGRPGRATRARITPEQAAEIRRLRAAGVPVKEIASRYPIKASAISHVLTGRTWKESA